MFLRGSNNDDEKKSRTETGNRNEVPQEWAGCAAIFRAATQTDGVLTIPRRGFWGRSSGAVCRPEPPPPAALLLDERSYGRASKRNEIRDKARQMWIVVILL